LALVSARQEIKRYIPYTYLWVDVGLDNDDDDDDDDDDDNLGGLGDTGRYPLRMTDFRWT